MRKASFLRSSPLFAAFAPCWSMPYCFASETANNVLEWVKRAEGSYINEKLVIRHLDPDDETSPFGVFTTADLEPKEKLMQIPHDLYIQIDDAKDLADTVLMAEDWMPAYTSTICTLAKRVMKEMKLGDESEYAPYVRYLNEQRTGQLPATWSANGKSMLRKLLDEESDMLDWIDNGFRGDCFDMTDDPLEEQVVALTKARCYDTALIPIWDMVNHDNGRLNTYHNSMYDEEGITVWASQKIKAGEEIFATYDECTDCGDTSDYWGTPEILRDFGFVENYPHRFVYNNPLIWWEIVEKENGEKVVRWDDDKNYEDDDDDDDDEEEDDEDDWNYGPAKGEAICFMRRELAKINELEKFDCDLIKDDVPLHECRTVAQYKAALAEGLEMAIQAAEKLQDSKAEFCNSGDAAEM